MRIIAILSFALTVVIGLACVPGDQPSELDERTAPIDESWPCWPNCPDPDGECFGECFEGVAYCDDPACCVEPGNCMCYLPDSPISQALCDQPCDDCFGECINGSYCDNPECCIEPDNCLCYAPEHSISKILCGSEESGELIGDSPVPEPDFPPVESSICDTCFGECINGSYCDDPECCIDPDYCLCYVPDHPISQILCGGDCFGECIGGGYCDAPECCIEPGICMCYDPSHPISEFMCR